MKHKRLFLQLALVMGASALASLRLEAQAMTVASGLPVENPPKSIAKKEPQPEDFNALFRSFLETDCVDVSKEAIDPKLTGLFSSETSNALYGRLKLKRKNMREPY
jgi:hypothetical protein